MNPTRILPDLQSSLLCEDVRQENNGKLMLIGILTMLPVPQVPVMAFKLFVCNRWTAGLGQFNESVRIVAPDQTTALRKNDGKFALPDPSLAYTSVTVFGNVEFKTAGTYYVEVLVDDVMKLRFPVPVVLVTPPPNAENPPTEEAPKA